MKKIVVFAVLFVLLGSLVQAENVIRSRIASNKVVQYKYNTFKILEKSCLLIHYYWDILEYRYKFIEGSVKPDSSPEVTEKYLKAMGNYNKLVKNISIRFKKENFASSDLFLNFSEFYKSTPKEAKPALDTVVGNLIKNYNYTYPDNGATDKFIRDYFPGYGYTDPDYWYRKGREVEREFLYARWQEEEKTYTQQKKFELTVEIGLVAGLKEKYPNLEVESKFPVNIGGHITMCAKVLFETKESITIKTKKKIGEYKIWFELFKAKKSFWNDPQWVLVGKTYEFFEEPTGEEVATGIKW